MFGAFFFGTLQNHHSVLQCILCASYGAPASGMPNNSYVQKWAPMSAGVNKHPIKHPNSELSGFRVLIIVGPYVCS